MAAGIPGLDVFDGRPNTAGIPGLDVYEDSRPPSVTSPEGRAAQQGLRGTAAPANSGPQISQGQRAMRSLRLGANGVLDKIPAGAKTAGRVLGKVAAPLAAGSAVADSLASDSTARYAKRFGVDEPTGDGSIGDIAKFVGLRAGGFASDLGNALTGGLAGKLYADNEPGAMPALPPAAPVAPPVTAGPADTRSFPTAPAVGPATGDGIRRVDRPGQTPLFTNAPGGDLSKFAPLQPETNPGEGFRQDRLTLARNAAERAAVVPESGSGGFGSTPAKAVAPTVEDLMRTGLSARQAQNAVQQAAELEQRREASQAQIASANQGQNQSLRIAEMNNATSRRGQDLGADVSLRGQDVTDTGNRLSYDAQTKRLRYEAGKAERDFQTGRADKGFEQRGQRETQLQKKIEDLTMTVDKDGKPVVDAGAAREYRTGLERSAARVGKSLADLDQADEQKLFAASDMLRTMRANSGILPWKPDQLKTVDPIDLTGMRVLPNGDRQITRKDSKAFGQTIPARFFQTEEGVRFFGGTKTNRFDILSEGQ